MLAFIRPHVHAQGVRLIGYTQPSPTYMRVSLAAAFEFFALERALGCASRVLGRASPASACSTFDGIFLGEAAKEKVKKSNSQKSESQKGEVSLDVFWIRDVFWLGPPALTRD